MFGFFRRPAPQPLSAAIRQAIEKDGSAPASIDRSHLQMVELKGRYTDRKVTFFRVFDPTTPAQNSLEIRRYEDFDVFADRVLWSGHIESDGAVILSRSTVIRASGASPRAQADRAMHADDSHIVRRETGASANPGTPQASTSEPAP